MPWATGSRPEARVVAVPDPVAWRAAILADKSARPAPQSLVQAPQLALESQRGAPRPRWQREQSTKTRQPKTVGATSGPHSQPAQEAAVEWPDERLWQPPSRFRQASPRMAAPVLCRNFFGPLATDTEELPDATALRDPTRAAGQLLPEQSGRGWRRKAQRPQAQSRSARQQRTAAAVGSTMDGPASAEAKTARQMSRSSPPTLGPLSDRPQFRDELYSEIGGAWSPSPPGQRRGGWSIPRPRPRSVVSCLHELAAAGSMSSRCPAWDVRHDHGNLWDNERAGPLSVRVESVVGRANDRGGTDHRSVRWGRPGAMTTGGERTAAAKGLASTERNGTGLGPRDPSLALPERAGGSEARDGQGSGSARRDRTRTSSSTSSPDLPDLDSREAVSASPRLGTASRLLQVQVPLEASALVLNDRQQHRVSVSRADWDGFDHFRHGASPDLIVALCLRQHLGCSELVRIELLSRAALVLSRGEWPASWEEFSSFVADGGFFRVGARLRGGMDPARKNRLDAVRFDSGTDWPMLDRCLEALRRQAPLPSEAGQQQRAIAELMAEAMPLRQWQLLETVPGIQGRCNATPARMMALALLLARPRARARDGDAAGVQPGRHVELRFNSVAPPPAPASGGGISMDMIRDEVLGKLEELAPAMWTDPMFSLRTVRKTMRLEGNLRALQTYSLTVLLPYGDWIPAFLSGQLSLGQGSYATVAPCGTHIEVELTPLDHTVFRAIRLSLGLSHADSLALLEDGLTRSLGGPVACRFTTSRRVVGGGGGGKPSFAHHSPDDEGASTLFTIEAAGLIVARREGLHLEFSLGEGDDQRPIALKIQLPGCPPWALKRMLASRVVPPLQFRAAGTLFLHPNVLIGPLAAGWMTDKLEHSASEEEMLRRGMAQVWRVCVQTSDIHFVGRRDKGDKNPLFVYAEFSSLEAARAFGANLDIRSFHPEFIAMWSRWMGDGPVSLWSCALLTEALEGAPTKTWKGLMDLGTQSPCPPPDPQPQVVNANAA